MTERLAASHTASGTGSRTLPADGPAVGLLLLRITLAVLAALIMLAIGVLWIVGPPAPSWWPLHDDWWLFGGSAVGITLVASALIAVGLLAYSVHRFCGKPEAVEAVDRMDQEHRARVAARKEARRRQEEEQARSQG